MAIKYGLIGCGHAGLSRHLPNVQVNPRTNLVGVCDLDEERAESAGRNFGVESYTDAEKMIGNEDIDAVSVATPPGTHRDVVLDIAETGVDMLVEKPFAVTVDRAEEMLAACEENDCRVTEVNNQLFHPIIRRVKREIESGAIGDVRTVLVQKSNETAREGIEGEPDWHAKIGGQGFGEILPHRTYLLRNFMGDVEEVEPVDTIPAASGLPFDVGEVNTYFQGDGTNGYLNISFETTCPDLFVVVGTEESILVDQEDRVAIRLASPRGADEVLQNNLHNAWNILRQTAMRALKHAETTGFRKLADNGLFVDRAYDTDGHYHQISEIAERRQEAMTVTPSDIVNNAYVYEEVIAEIEARREEMATGDN